MLYHLFKYLDEAGISGAGVFQYISFRAALAGILSLLIALLIGKRIIYWLQKKQIGETIRNLGLEGQMQKKGTPTMGGIIILLSITIPTLLFARLDNVYVILMLISTLWMGMIGAAFGLGFVFGPPIGGWLAKAGGMHYIGITTGVLCLFNFVLAWFTLPESLTDRTRDRMPWYQSFQAIGSPESRVS